VLDGLLLTLMVGPAVPVPVPQVVLDALTAIEVRTSDSDRSVFQLTFTLSTRSPLHTIFLLAAGQMVPILRTVIIATVNGLPDVLIDGVVTQTQVAPGSDAGHATLTVTGEDLTAVMDYLDLTGLPYPAMPAEARVELILAKYALFGVIPLVIPSVLIDVPVPTDRLPVQRGTDLAYVKSMAADVGYVFYIEPGPAPLTSVAYWGPQIKVGIPQPALNQNMDAQTNVESLSFTFDSQSAKQPVLFIRSDLLGVTIPVPIPDVSLLNPPLGVIPPLRHRIEPIADTAKYSLPQAGMSALATASRSSDAVSGSGTLNVLRYGRLLKARQLVGVRGAGLAFDGLHYVASVTHSIKRGEYKQSFTLSRNGLLSTVPTVVP
jgi:hypothetical protein